MLSMMKSKTFYAGLLLIAKGLYDIFAEDNFDQGSKLMVEGAALVFLRHAIAKGK